MLKDPITTLKTNVIAVLIIAWVIIVVTFTLVKFLPPA